MVMENATRVNTVLSLSLNSSMKQYKKDIVTEKVFSQKGIITVVRTLKYSSIDN